MNEKNYDFLKNQMKGLGFGESHGEELKMKMESGIPEFVIGHASEYGKDNASALLHFKKAANIDMYFFNNYSLSVKADDKIAPLQQTFYTADHFTLKEGYNLLSGRAVFNEKQNKEGESYKAWFQLDFKQTDGNGNFKMQTYHSNYGFDLNKELAKYALKELTEPTQREYLVKALERGNQQMATFANGGPEKKVFLETAPQYKVINFHDGMGNRLKREDFYVKAASVSEGEIVKTQENGKSERQSAKKETKQSKDDSEGEGGDTLEKPKRKRKRQSIG